MMKKPSASARSNIYLSNLTRLIALNTSRAPVINFANLLKRQPNEQQLLALAQQVAGRTRPVVWQRVSHRISTMGSSETRGYVRARAAMIVDREVELAIHRDQRFNPTSHSSVAGAAMDALVHMIEIQSRMAKQPDRQVA